MPREAPASLVVLASGRGSNLRALWDAMAQGRCAMRLRAVLSDRAAAPALRFARRCGVATHVVPRERGECREAWSARLGEAVATHRPDWVVLAGFMRILGVCFVRRFSGRIVNVHPSLLPAFPGLDAPRQALEAGVAITGCTVHLVDEGVDTGPILAQAAVPIVAGDDVETLHARIQRQEHRLLPAVLDALAKGALRPGRPPRWEAGKGDEGATLWAPIASSVATP